NLVIVRIPCYIFNKFIIGKLQSIIASLMPVPEKLLDIYTESRVFESNIDAKKLFNILVNYL
ncbi:MAG: hypothetical protein ACC651_08360, partial [Candidatus Scalindua sp.]